MDTASAMKLRREIQTALASLFAELGPIQDALLAVTRRAQAENWEMPKYLQERELLRKDKERVGKEIERRTQELKALDGEQGATIAKPPETTVFPTFVRFSRIAANVDSSLASLHEALVNLNCGIRRLIPLRRSDANAEEDGGLEYAGDPHPGASLADLLPVSRSSAAFALVYLARDPGSLFSFVIFDRSEHGFSITLDVGERIVAYETDEMERGRWLDGLLVTATRALKPDVCSYGLTPSMKIDYSPLDPESVLTLLRTGELLTLPRPSFHALSVNLISVQEVTSLLAQFGGSDTSDYRMTHGYHLLGHA